MVAYNIAKHIKPFSDGDLKKVYARCTQYRQKFEEAGLSRRTVTRRIEIIDKT